MEIGTARKILESYIPNKKYYEEMIIELEEMKKQQSKLIEKYGSIEYIDSEIKKFTHLQQKSLNDIKDIETCINLLNQPSKNVLYYKYIRNISNHKIAMRLNYSLPRIYQLINIAIKEFAEQYDKFTKEYEEEKEYSKL